ncbi:MAG: HpcH/HpaI aldolase/citrate lyase family protein [Campylobacterales bacterium]|nr:HpcH/HpaI aldolase/citrate lyase family protein [Campylobacterales bacterium]
MQCLDAIDLGGTLFVPATHTSLEAILLENKYPDLKSVLIDTEDGLSQTEIEQALQKVQLLLSKLAEPTLYIFLRPTNPEILQQILSFNGIEKVHGFILPKFSLLNASEYLGLLKSTSHFFMPSIEGEELFNPVKLLELRDVLIKEKKRVPLVRFGLEDMLLALGMRRKCEESLFDVSATNFVLGSFIATFKSAGFSVSGGVYPCFKDSEGFNKDVSRDLKEGLFSKTIIHPIQITLTNELYKVTKEELIEAELIVNSKEAVFSLNEKMAETSTMAKHSRFILKRAQVYGIKE